MRAGRGRQAGFTYVGLLLAVVVMGLMLTVASRVWSTTEQREREKKLEQLIEEAKKEGRDPEPLKRELTSFIECATTGREPRVSGFQATAALELAVKITEQISRNGPSTN